MEKLHRIIPPASPFCQKDTKGEVEGEDNALPGWYCYFAFVQGFACSKVLVCIHLLDSHNSVKSGKTSFLLVFTIPIFTQDRIQVSRDRLRGAARRAPQSPSPLAALGSCCVTWSALVSSSAGPMRKSFPEPDWDPFRVLLLLALSALSGFPDPILMLTQGYHLHVKLLHTAGFWFVHLWSGF